jgi:tryptophan synthase beta chain
MPTLSAPVSQVPDARGRFGPYGGRFVPETLMFALEQLDAAYRSAKLDPAFTGEFTRILNGCTLRSGSRRQLAALAST